MMGNSADLNQEDKQNIKQHFESYFNAIKAYDSTVKKGQLEALKADINSLPEGVKGELSTMLSEIDKAITTTTSTSENKSITTDTKTKPTKDSVISELQAFKDPFLEKCITGILTPPSPTDAEMTVFVVRLKRRDTDNIKLITKASEFINDKDLTAAIKFNIKEALILEVLKDESIPASAKQLKTKITSVFKNEAALDKKVDEVFTALSTTPTQDVKKLITSTIESSKTSAAGTAPVVGGLPVPPTPSVSNSGGQDKHKITQSHNITPGS